MHSNYDKSGEIALKKYTEIGFGNRWFIRTELEHEDGTESEIKGFFKPFQLQSVYIRIWVGRRVLIIDSSEGVKCNVKKRKGLKFIIGFSGL